MSLHHGADDAVSLMFSSTGAQETGSSNFGGSIIVPFPLAFRYETISGLMQRTRGARGEKTRVRVLENRNIKRVEKGAEMD